MLCSSTYLPTNLSRDPIIFIALDDDDNDNNDILHTVSAISQKYHTVTIYFPFPFPLLSPLSPTTSRIQNPESRIQMQVQVQVQVQVQPDPPTAGPDHGTRVQAAAGGGRPIQTAGTPGCAVPRRAISRFLRSTLARSLARSAPGARVCASGVFLAFPFGAFGSRALPSGCGPGAGRKNGDICVCLLLS